jgi:hypothetical protein
MQLANAPLHIGGFFAGGGVGTWQERPSSAMKAEYEDKEHMRIQMTCNGSAKTDMPLSGTDCGIAVRPASQQMGRLFSSRLPRLEARR